MKVTTPALEVEISAKLNGREPIWTNHGQKPTVICMIVDGSESEFPMAKNSKECPVFNLKNF